MERYIYHSKAALLMVMLFCSMLFCFISAHAASAPKDKESSDTKNGSPILIRTMGTSKSHSVELEWKKVQGASSYIVERHRKKIEISRSVKKTTFTDKTAKKNGVYQYKISAVKKGTQIPVGTVTIKVRKPKALILDCSGRNDPGRMKTYLKNAGFSVTVIKDAVYVNHRKDVMVEDYDALVVPGGNSVNPEFYNDKARNSHSNFGKKENDRIQIDAVKQFAKAKKPVLGICRGCQLVNVAFKGTLTQCLGTPHTHMSGVSRKVTIAKNTWLYHRFGTSMTTIHSHHQNVKKLGNGLYATQWDEEDGNIEGFEHETLPVYGLQWHPDKWKGKDGRKRTYRTGIEVFTEFRSVCQQWMASE